MNSMIFFRRDDGASKDKAFAPLLVLGILLTVTICAYSAVLTSSFGIMDDYVFLANAIANNKQNFVLLAANGRPLNGILIELGFQAAASINNLAYLRAIGLIGIFLVGSGLYVLGKKHGLSDLVSLIVAIGVILLPSFQVYAAWAQHFTTPYAGLLALASVYFITPGTLVYKRSTAGAMLISVMLLVLALLIYQPMAMLFCTSSILLISSTEKTQSNIFLRTAVIRLIVFSTAMLIGFLVFKWGQSIHPSNSARFGMVRDIASKLRWFFDEPVLNGLSLYSVLSNPVIIFSVSVLLISGLISMTVLHGIVETLLAFTIVVFCLIGSAIPNLLTGENWASYRSLGAFYAGILLLVILLCRESYALAASIFPKLSRRFGSLSTRSAAATVFFIPIIVLTQYHVTRSFVLPNVTELNNVASVLIDWSRDHHPRTTIYVIPAVWTDSYALPIAYDEFGMPSSITPIYAQTMVGLLLNTSTLIPDVTLASQESKPLAGSDSNVDTLVVDFSRMVTSNRARVFTEP